MVKYMRNKKSPSRQLRSSHYQKPSGHCIFKKRATSQELAFTATEKCAWTDATCPVCMEFPHNAVLLLCSSHDNGCRPYICASNYQHSNCLDQLVESCRKENAEDPDTIEVTCPLCRGEVKGYTLVEPARKKLNRKRRSCMQDGCSYMGTYRELCKHVKRKHPFANPRAVDPVHASRWKRLLFRSSLQDMICSTTSPLLHRILSAMLQVDDLRAPAWGEGGDLRGATNDSSQQGANAESTDLWSLDLSLLILQGTLHGSLTWSPADSQFLTCQNSTGPHLFTVNLPVLILRRNWLLSFDGALVMCPSNSVGALVHTSF
jgi:hypothetical protein